jgi:hypothetical protein
MRKQIPAILLLLAVGACATDQELGATINHNIVTQVVDMDPKYAGTPMEGSNGKRSVAAYQRYLNGNVKALTKVDSSSRVGSQGGAGDSSTPQGN